MTVVKFKHRPFEQNFNSWMDDFFASASSMHKEAAPAFKSSIPVNVYETENGYQVQVVAPGFEKEAFALKLVESLLTISAEAKKEEQAHKPLRREFSFRPFRRSFTLDETVDAENITAEYKNGVLTLNLPRKAEVKPAVKNITIQ